MALFNLNGLVVIEKAGAESKAIEKGLGRNGWGLGRGGRRERDRETERERETDRERQTERERETDRERQTERDVKPPALPKFHFLL